MVCTSDRLCCSSLRISCSKALSSLELSAPGIMKELQSKEEFEDLLAGDNVLVVDWSATWCGPCRAIAPVLDNIEKSLTGKAVVFVKIDVDRLHELAAEYRISAMPTIHIFRNRERLCEIVGADPAKITSAIHECVA